MRRAVLPEPIVVGVAALAPPGVGVVAGLLGQDRQIILDEFDHSIVLAVRVHGWQAYATLSASPERSLK